MSKKEHILVKYLKLKITCKFKLARQHYVRGAARRASQGHERSGGRLVHVGAGQRHVAARRVLRRWRHVVTEEGRSGQRRSWRISQRRSWRILSTG